MMHQPACVCESPLCPAEGKFYVTVRDGDRHAFLLGPYPTHEAALENVDRGRSLANAADPRAHWYAYGTARVTDAAYSPKTLFGA